MSGPPDRGTAVLRGGAIGDFVVTLPLLAGLRQAYPAARLAVVAHGQVGALAEAGGLADEVRALDSRAIASFFQNAQPPDAEWVAWFRGFTRIISFLHDPTGDLHGQLGHSGAQVIRGPTRPLDGHGTAASQLADPVLGALGLPRIDPGTFRLTLPCAAHDQAELILRTGPWMALHPGSGSPRKNWPVERWAGFVTRLFAARPEVRLLLLGGEADADAVQALSSRLPPARLHVVFDAPLAHVAGLLAACEYFLGHDSGLAHLAAAVGIPVFQLFGRGDPSVWSPPQTGVIAIPAPGGDLHRLEVDAVWAQFAAAQGPGGKGGISP